MKRLIFIFALFLLFANSEGQIIRANSFARAQVSSACIGTQNLVMYSEQLNNGVWAGGGMSVTDTDCENDLEGNATLEEITVTDGTCNFQYSNSAAWVVVTPSTTYRWSFDVKRGTATELKWSAYDRTGSAEIIPATSYYLQTAASVQRVSLEFTTPAGCVAASVFFLRDIGTTGTVYLGRAQVETNGSCYIETTSAIITP